MIGGTAGYGGALPPTGLDLSDLRRAMLDLRNRAGLRSGRVPWARCTIALHAIRADPDDADRTGRGAGTTALPPPGRTSETGTSRGGSAGSTATPAEPHPTDPRPNRTSSRALRNPAPRRPVDAETSKPAVVGQPPAGAGHGPTPEQSTGRPSQGSGPGAPGPGRPGNGGPPGRVPPSRGSRRERPASDETPRNDSTAAPGGADGGDEVWRLVKQAQEGDAQAFARIYDRYFDTVYRYISYRTGSRTVAEDLTSEVWLRALRRIGSVSWQGRDLGAWLVTIARNLIADHYKSGRQRLEVTTADMLDNDDVALGPEGRPEDAVLTRLDNATLLDAVRRLNPEQQECITLRFLQGLSVTETAQIMGKNDGAIKALQYRAVRTLGRLLPEGFTP